MHICSYFVGKRFSQECRNLKLFQRLYNYRHSQTICKYERTRKHSSATILQESENHLRKSILPLLSKVTQLNLSKLSNSSSLIDKLEQYKAKWNEVEELQFLLKSDNNDSKMAKLIEEEQILIESKLQELEKVIASLLIPPDPADNSNVIIEVSAGVGGAEAMLFSRELFNMYLTYVQFKGWRVDVVIQDETELGGLRKGSIMVEGACAYRHLKFEGGVHRVQRVPKTEKSGRVHTSTATVAVLPEPSEIDVVINPKDLQMQTFRASGPGGQHVNKTESAVRLIHVPTGIIAECQTSRSQLKNRETAIKVLRSRIFERVLQKQNNEIQSRRKIQVGSASRSEKIRTYNYQQDRVTDHRLGYSAHNLPSFLSGSELLDTMIAKLINESDNEVLQESLNALQ